MKYKVVSHSPRETQRLGQKLAPLLGPGDLLSLTGDLGAGKTCFIQGLAKGLGIKERVTSPTFTLIKEYHPQTPESGIRVPCPPSLRSGAGRRASSESRVPEVGGLVLYHFDCYRLSSFQELYDLGYEEYFFSQGVVAIEWGDKISPLLPANYLKIALKLSSERIREIEVIPYGSRGKNLARKWLSRGGVR